MRRPYSLRRRLLIGLTAALVALGGVALIDSWLEARETADALSDRVLAGSVLAIAERVVVTEDGELEVDVPYVALEMLTSAAQDRVFYRVDGPDGFITGYQALPVVAEVGPQLQFIDGTFRDEAIRLASLRRAASSGARSISFTVTVAETTIARTQLSQALLVRSAIRLFAMCVAAVLVLWLAVNLSLSPLYRLRNAIARRAGDDLSAINETVPREVQGLVETINSFMRRLAGALDALRHFTGNASHQLRTPLAVVRTQLALAERAETLEVARGHLRTADDAVGHSERVLAQLLLLARIDEAASDRMQRERIDLEALAREITANLVPKAHAAGIDLGFEGDGTAPIAADAMLVGEMARNLIENAIAYAGDGAEATVSIRRAGGVVLEVADTGRGLAPEELADVRKRFHRGASERPGAGLGLPIVEEIAALFGGRMEVDSAPGAGFRVRITFPDVSAAGQ